MENYRQRVADDILRFKLEAKGAVLIEGPKWCGKTTTAEQQARTVMPLAKNDVRERIQYLLDIDTETALSGETPLLIDEWQTVPKLWDAVRYEVDHRRRMGQFILTGSAVPDKREADDIHHTGTGRFSRMKMRTMTLFESGESTGSVSLGALFNAPDKILEESHLRLEDIAFAICRGGWPMAIDLSERAALSQATDYFDAVTQEDITRVDGVRRSSERARSLMHSYARHQGTQASIATLREDIEAGNSLKMTDDTIVSYIDALCKIFVIEDMPAWNPNLRSKTAIRTAPTRYFVDPSIATAALGIGPQDLLNDLNTMGLLFETLCVRDLRVFADSLDGQVYHFRSKSGLECDTVVHLRDGRYGLIEIKLGGTSLIEQGAATLTELTRQIDTDRMRAPSFRMVLTAVGDHAYRRPQDGIYVVPVGTLRN